MFLLYVYVSVLLQMLDYSQIVLLLKQNVCNQCEVDLSIVFLFFAVCPNITVTLTSSCGRPVSAAIFSGLKATEQLPTSPGTYIVSVCEPSDPVTVTISGHNPLDVSSSTFANNFTRMLTCSGKKWTVLQRTFQCFVHVVVLYVWSIFHHIVRVLGSRTKATLKYLF